MSDREGEIPRFGEIDIGTTDFGSLLSELAVLEQTARFYRGRFRMPRLVFPVIPVTEFGQAWSFENATVRNLRTSLWQGTLQGAVVADSNTAVQNALVALCRGQAFNSTVWAPKQTGATKAVPASGASPLTVFAAAGVGLKRRVFDIAISSSAAGVVVLSDGLGSIRATTGPATVIHYGPDGVLQDTANTAITATLAAATLEAIAVGNAGE